MKEHFEANMLDGDKVEDCGGAMLSAEDVWKYIENELLKEVANEFVEAVEEEDDWLEMHKVESSFESGKLVGIGRALTIVKDIAKKYNIENKLTT